MSEAVRREVVTQSIWWFVLSGQVVLTGLFEWGIFAVLQNPSPLLIFGPLVLWLIPMAKIAASIARQVRLEKVEAGGQDLVAAAPDLPRPRRLVQSSLWASANRHPFAVSGTAAVIVAVVATVLVLTLHISR
jgi:hypothetical protein